jgi:hypothetical protein
MTGQAYDSPFGSKAAVSADETFEWLTGEHFLIHRLAGRVGGDEMACIEILRRNPAAETFIAHTFYNDGSANTWHLEPHGDAWIMSGRWPKGGDAFQVRCSITFDDRAHRRATWEYSADGANWHVFWLTEAVRVS